MARSDPNPQQGPNPQQDSNSQQDPSKKHWLLIGVAIPIIVALIAIVPKIFSSPKEPPPQPQVIVNPLQVKPPCSTSQRAEHDQKQSDVQKYDAAVTDNEQKLQDENNALAVATSLHDDSSAQAHSALAKRYQEGIAEFKDDRDQAAKRVTDIEQGCAL